MSNLAFSPKIDANNNTYSKLYYTNLYPSTSNLTYSDMVGYVDSTALGYITTDGTSLTIYNANQTGINDTVATNNIVSNSLQTNTANTNVLNTQTLQINSYPVLVSPVTIQNAGFTYPIINLSNTITNLNLDLTQPLYISIQPNWKIIFFYQNQVLGYIYNNTTDYLYNQGITFNNLDSYQIIYIN